MDPQVQRFIILKEDLLKPDKDVTMREHLPLYQYDGRLKMRKFIMFKIEPKDSRDIIYKKFKKYLQNQGIKIIKKKDD